MATIRFGLAPYQFDPLRLERPNRPKFPKVCPKCGAKALHYYPLDVWPFVQSLIYECSYIDPKYGKVHGQYRGCIGATQDDVTHFFGECGKLYGESL